MFFDDSLKELKKELRNAGGDVSFVKGWQKCYDKIQKQSPVIQSQYIKAKTDLQTVMNCLKGMEELLTSGMDLPLMKKEIFIFIKEMKKYQKGFDYEFLVSKEDKEFHLIYDTILVLGEKDIREKQDILILQSEVENLMAVTQEALGKKWPSFRAMAYFYIDRTDKELSDFPHLDKVERVQCIYEDEFVKPMMQVLESAFGQERAKKIMEVELWI